MRAANLRRDRRGVTTIVFAASSVVLLSLAGMVIDFGNVYSAKRHLQGTTDLAAMAAASNLPAATEAADGNASINGFTPGDVSQVRLGVYTPNTNIPPAQRFVPSTLATANAVQVTMQHKQPLMFANVYKLLSGNVNTLSSETLTTQSIAATNQFVSFGIGSQVAGFNGGIVNAILSATLGGNISLSLVDYQSLANAQIDLFALGKALSLQAGQVGGTYGGAVKQTISTTAFLQALATAAPSLAPVLDYLATQANASGGTVDLTKLINFGPYANYQVSDPEPQAGVSASALQLVQIIAGLNTTPHLINLNINANIPGISAVTAMMTLGEPAQNTTMIAVDPTGTSVHTAQVRLFVNITLGSSVLGVAVQLPLYVEVGYGTAVLNGVGCQPLNSAATTATLGVTPGLVNGWIGNVTAAQMTNFTNEPTVTPATLLNVLNLVTVTGSANATIGNTTPTAVTFSASDMANNVIKPTNTTDFTGALISSLIGNLQMQANVLGLGINPGQVTSLVAAALAPVTTPVDQLLSGILQDVGVDVGQADTWVSGARCSAGSTVG